jgi:IMP dehydrogenase
MSLITFNDICIDSQYSEISSRSTVDVSTKLGKIKLDFPVISANMPDITEYKMALEMAANGGLGIIHRFMSIEENIKQFTRFTEFSKNPIWNEYKKLSEGCGVSIGIKDGEKERFDKLYNIGARLFCIDIAHGHSLMMKEMITWIKKHAKDVCLIAGNIATKDAALDLAEWGADVVKVGIGPGMVCKTRSNTGVGKPQFSALKEVYGALQRERSEVAIISDGGIKTTGDVAKALIFADAVMVGAVLAGTIETPGEVYSVEGTDLTNKTYYKMYGGSASAENKVKNGQTSRFVEGEMRRIPFKGHAKYLLGEIRDGLQSALSYSGASNLKEYKKKVKWEMISGAGKAESKL